MAWFVRTSWGLPELNPFFVVNRFSGHYKFQIAGLRRFARIARTIWNSGFSMKWFVRIDSRESPWCALRSDEPSKCQTSLRKHDTMFCHMSLSHPYLEAPKKHPKSHQNTKNTHTHTHTHAPRFTWTFSKSSSELLPSFLWREWIRNPTEIVQKNLLRWTILRGVDFFRVDFPPLIIKSVAVAATELPGGSSQSNTGFRNPTNPTLDQK